MKTDSQLQLDVIEELKWEPSVDATTIGVEVKDGVECRHCHFAAEEKFNEQVTSG